MRRFIMAGLLLVLVVMALPTAMGRLFTGERAVAPPVDGEDSLTVEVYFPVTKRTEELILGEYLKGVVAAEMPAEFVDEALKAQMVVARTYVVRRMHRFTGKGGCPLEQTADVCADIATGQAYMSREQLAAKLGKFAANTFWQRLEQVQVATKGLVLAYQGELIDPLYHSVSGTMTEDSGDYFSQSLPYLKPVDDQWGKDSPKLFDVKRLTPDQLARALEAGGKTVSVPALASRVNGGQPPIEIVSRTGTGRVKTIKVGDLQLTGRQFRELLGLRSTDFTVEAEKGQVVIRTRGYGHGVGMSQYGANGMAKAGKPFPEILSHYYSGAILQRIYSE